MAKKFLIFIIVVLVLGSGAAAALVLARIPWVVERSAAPTYTPIVERTPAPTHTAFVTEPARPTFTPMPTEVTPAGQAVEPAECSPAVTLTPGTDGRVVYGGVSFLLDPALAASVEAQECPAIGNSDSDPWAAHPSYVGFRFPVDRERLIVFPELRVYNVEGDMTPYTYPINALEDLRVAVTAQPQLVSWFERTPLHVHRAYTAFQNGKGVRGVVEYAQDYFFYLNNDLLYVYDGLSDDGRTYINFRYPVAAPFLLDIEYSDPSTNFNPQAIEVPEWTGEYEKQREIIDAYNQEALRRFAAMQEDEFAPGLPALDALVESIQVVR